MLYKNTDLLYFYIIVKNLINKINVHIYFRDVFYFSEIINGHVSNFKRGNAILNAGELDYFEDDTNSNLIVEFVNRRPNMYSFTVFEASKRIQKLK